MEETEHPEPVSDTEVTELDDSLGIFMLEVQQMIASRDREAKRRGRRRARNETLAALDREQDAVAERDQFFNALRKSNIRVAELEAQLGESKDKVAELERENAELKEKLAGLEIQRDRDCTPSGGVRGCANEAPTCPMVNQWLKGQGLIARLPARLARILKRWINSMAVHYQLRYGNWSGAGKV
ncbi:hypothetical protein B0T16DRAFT_421497 [Cercophora newfieldiana]|uniref:Uncharacterized protein n=1 Tax=Cercophora newfieldiana TaxID=92897 RepID=A0AA39XR28_9PEZI|nr:hypothetical protein B0T16DRAFT_421497 [Cercophora newfieldiana]